MENKKPTPIELLKMFAEGAKIRMKHWRSDPDRYIFLTSDGYISDESGINFSASLERVLSGDYELYREPKKLKRYWLWDIQTKSGDWYREDNYICESGFRTSGRHHFSHDPWDNYEKRKAEPEQFIDVEVES